MATTLTVGQIAITAVNTEDNGNPQRDLINVLLLAQLDAGTVIYLSDRAWNGTAFAAAGGGDGTFAYTVPAGGLPAGSFLNITQAQLTGAGIDLSDAGETIYLYQGASANAPTTFLHAVDIADGTSGFDGNELLNTGLVNGTSAVGISVDNAEFATRSWDIQRGDLFTAINTASHWAQNDNSPQDGTAADTPTNVAPDAQIWIAGSGAGEAIVTINLDGTYNTGNVGYQISQAFQNDPGLYHPSDITLDTVHDRYFFVDSDAQGHNRILQGSISQVLNNPGGPLVTTVLYSNAGSDATGIIQSLSVDTAHSIIYFDTGSDANGSSFNKIGYNTANQTPTVLATLGAGHYVTQVAIDYTHGEVYLATSQIEAVFGQDIISQNYIYRASGLTTASTTLTFTELPFAQQDDNFGTEADPLSGEAFPVERGTIRGIDVDPVTHTLYIATGSASLDNDGDGFTTYYGGVYRYALDSNPTGNISTVFVQNGATGPAGLLYYLEVDAATGKYYVIDETGTNALAGDGGVWVGSLSANNTLPTLLATVGNINGLGPRGLEIQHASVLSGTSLLATFTEAAGNPSPAGVAIAPAGSFQATDADSGGDPNADELAGAQVRVSAGFQSGAGHQDVLTINGLTSGSVSQGNGDVISYSYNAATGVLTLSGVSTLDNYESMLGLVRFSVTGDNPTLYGTDTSRTISYATFDGLLYSDEVNASLTVTGTNDAPVNFVPTGTTIVEDANPGKVFSTANANALSVSDVDANPAAQPLSVTLSVGHGTLTLARLTGLTFTTGDGTGDTTMTFTGTANAINAALGSGLSYIATLDYYGSDTLTLITSDQGASGTGGALSDTDTVAIAITGVADAVNDTATINEDAGPTNILVQGNDTFENANHAITAVSQGAHGTVTINNNGTVGDAADDYLVYTSDADYFGSDSFTYTVTSGGATETATVSVTVNPVNDAPSASATATSPTYVENATAVTPFSNFVASTFEAGQLFTKLVLTVTNVDGGHDALTIGGNTLTLTNGATSSASGVTATVALAGTTATVTFTSVGVSATVLQGLVNAMGYRYDGEDPSSADRVITITSITDNGGTVNGGIDTTTLAIASTVHVTPVNDAPVDTVPAAFAIAEDAIPGQVFSAANANALHVSDVDADPATQELSVTLSVDHGSLTLASIAGLTFSVGDGTADSTLTFTGTADAINAALDAGLTYTATADYNGSDTLTLTTSDQGFSGTGGAQSDTNTVAITIGAVADIANDSVTVGEDGGAVPLDLLVNDSFEDAGRAITAVGLAAHGIVAIDDNGTAGDTTDDFVTYTADADYNGADSFTYTVTSGGVDETATVTVTVSAVADIANDSVTVGEDGGAVPLDLLANDSFEDAGRAITAVGLAAHGIVAIDDNGTAGDATDDFVTYTADADYNGADSFTYTVTSGGVSETATVNVTVSAVADIADDVATTGEDTAVDILVLANDSFESNAYAITATGIAAHGIVTVNDAGTAGDTTDDYLVYTADPDYNGTDSFTYTVTSGGLTETATVNVTVSAVADIVADSVTVSEDGGITPLDLLANDSFEDPSRAITAVGLAAHGIVAIDDNGTAGDTTDDFVTYTADADYNGADSFTYTVTSGGVTETATVNVSIGAVADIADDTATTNEDSAVSVLVLANDTFESLDYAITAVGAAAHGSVTIDDNGTVGDTTDDFVTYTADSDYNGADSFSYTVTSGGTIETATVNVTVSAVADILADSVTVVEDGGAAPLDVLANDSFEDAGRVITAVGLAAHGVVTIDDNGTAGDATDDFVTYTADADYNGADSFTYTVTSDGTIETAIVNVTVSAVADILADSVTVVEDGGAVPLDLLANDSFEDAGRAITAVGVAAHGVVAIDDNGTAGDATDDFVTYTADADYNGADSFTYTVTSDGTTETATVNVTVSAVGDIVADTATTSEDTAVNILVQANDTFEDSGHAITAVGAAAHGTVTINDNGTAGNTTDDFVTYTANADYNGADSFTYTVTSDGTTETATVNVTVSAAADIVADTATTSEDTAVNILVQTNDTFENASHAITAVGSAAHGTVTIDDNGTAGDTTDDFVTYTANADYNGTDSFTYTVTSGGRTETATVNVTVGAVADIVADSVTVNEGAAAVRLDLLANDSFENPNRAITAVGVATHGTVAINNNGTAGDKTDDYVTYTADADYNGTDSFTYTVTSGGVTETATVTVTAAPVNDAPSGTNGATTIAEDTSYTFAGSDFGFSDSDGNAPLSVILTTIPPKGSLILDDGVHPATVLVAGDRVSFADIQSGYLSFVAAADANGTARFTFQVQDDGGTANGGVDTDPTANTFTITLTPIDDAPVAVDDRNITTAENRRTDIAVVANDRDADGGPKTVTAVNGTALAAVGDFVVLASGATVTLLGDGTLRYDPNHQFDYLISDDLARRTGATDNQATDSFTYTLNGGSSATVTLSITGVNGASDELRGSARDDVMTLYGKPVFVDGGAGVDTLIVPMDRTIVVADGEWVNFERIVVRDGSSLDLSAVHAPVGRLRAAAIAHDGVSITGTQGDDVISGGRGHDTLIGAGGDDHILLVDTPDRVDGGAGIDGVIVRSGADVTLTDANFSGVEYVRVKDGATLDMSGVTTRVGSIRAASAAGGGVEIIGSQVRDHIVGGNGNDILAGGKGADILTGGGGDDVFRFDALSDFSRGTRDRITDFRTDHDTIDLSAIDPDAAHGGNQAFTFIGGAAFTGHSGTDFELRFESAAGGNLLVQGNINHDGRADFSFLVQAATLHATDFVL